MNVQLRPMPLASTRARFSDEELAREERSRALLARLGVKTRPAEVDLLTGRVILWECVDGAQVLGHCTGDCLTGEILTLDVAASHEGRGIGRTLLFHVAGLLRAAGARRVWLVGPADSRTRAHGFYRAVGCRSTGARTASGDEILEVPSQAPPAGESRRTCGQG
jgi:ribosomal protein S18 acetylase RimI-like enzyme